MNDVPLRGTQRHADRLKLTDMFGSKNDALVASLREVYGAEDGDACFGALSELLEATSGQRLAKKKNKCEAGPRDYNVPCLIAYGDSLVPEDMSSHASPKKKRKTKQVSKTGTTPCSTFDTL